MVAVKNKAQIWVFEGIKEIKGRLPFSILGIDSDNGAEFINAHLIRYCEEHKITFTRSRPYRKNDSCFVEQKNWSVIRRAVGYGRYDTDKELSILNELYHYLRLYTNFFQPVRKLIKKERIGSKVIKRYDEAKTPYRRVLASAVHISNLMPHIDRSSSSKLDIFKTSLIASSNAQWHKDNLDPLVNIRPIIINRQSTAALLSPMA